MPSRRDRSMLAEHDGQNLSAQHHFSDRDVDLTRHMRPRSQPPPSLDFSAPLNNSCLA